MQDKTNVKQDILQDINTNPTIGNYISAVNLEAFTKLNQKYQLELIGKAINNRFAIVQLAAVVKDPDIQKHTLKIIEHNVKDDYIKQQAIKSVINNVKDLEVAKQALYTSFNVAGNEQDFKQMWNMKQSEVLDVAKVGEEKIKGQNEGLNINSKDLTNAYKSMSAAGKPLDEKKQAQLEQSTEFKGILDKIVNAIKGFLGIGVKTQTREEMQESVKKITKAMNVDDKSLEKSKENKSNQKSMAH